jgi:hypothetical protein
LLSELVAFLVAKMLIPVYLRGASYYLHIRIGSKQFKRSLKTTHKPLAIMRACQLMETIYMSKPKLSDFNLNTEEIRRYEIEMNGMRIKSDNADDHARALQTIQALQKFTNHPSSPPSVAVEAGAHSLPIRA